MKQGNRKNGAEKSKEKKEQSAALIPDTLLSSLINGKT